MTAKSLKHKFASAVADGADPTVVRPSNWNDDHNFYLGINAQTNTSYTIADTDAWTLITYNNAAAVAVTLPQAGASAQFTSGHVTFHRNLGAGVVTVTPTTSTINSTSSLILNQGQNAIIISDGANYFALVSGDVTSPTNWTPTDASGAGLALTVNSAKYIKFGKQVTILFDITYPATASGATALIGGLPATVLNS